MMKAEEVVRKMRHHVGEIEKLFCEAGKEILEAEEVKERSLREKFDEFYGGGRNDNPIVVCRFMSSMANRHFKERVMRAFEEVTNISKEHPTLATRKDEIRQSLQSVFENEE